MTILSSVSFFFFHSIFHSSKIWDSSLLSWKERWVCFSLWFSLSSLFSRRFFTHQNPWTKSARTTNTLPTRPRVTFCGTVNYTFDRFALSSIDEGIRFFSSGIMQCLHYFPSRWGRVLRRSDTVKAFFVGSPFHLCAFVRFKVRWWKTRWTRHFFLFFLQFLMMMMSE